MNVSQKEQKENILVLKLENIGTSITTSKSNALTRQIQINDNFSNLTNPVLTTAQNDENIDIFDSDTPSSPVYKGILCMSTSVDMG